MVPENETSQPLVPNRDGIARTTHRLVELKVNMLEVGKKIGARSRVFRPISVYTLTQTSCTCTVKVAYSYIQCSCPSAEAEVHNKT